MTFPGDTLTRDLQQAAAVARCALIALSPTNDTPIRDLEAVSGLLVTLSEQLAELGHDACYDPPLHQQLNDLRIELDGHLRAASAMGDLELPRQRSVVLLRVARGIAAELDVMVGQTDNLRSA